MSMLTRKPRTVPELKEYLKSRLVAQGETNIDYIISFGEYVPKGSRSKLYSSGPVQVEVIVMTFEGVESKKYVTLRDGSDSI